MSEHRPAYGSPEDLARLRADGAALRQELADLRSHSAAPGREQAPPAAVAALYYPAPVDVPRLVIAGGAE